MKMEVNYWKFYPKKFHKYPSSVFNVIASADTDSEKEILAMKMDLIHLFKDARIPAYNDNKIVFEMQYGPSTIYIGFYTSHMDIGFGVFTG